MPLVIHCPKCAKRYQVADAAAGKQVRCQQCQTTFVAAARAPAPAPAPLDPLGVNDPLGGANLSHLPAAAVPAASANPLGTPVKSTAGGFYPAAPTAASTGVSNPSGGPTDNVMRLISGAMLALGLVMTVGSLALNAANGTVYLAVIGLAPLCLILGIAGLISPNVVRACGKYGGHLPWQYKAIGYGLMGLYLVILILLMIGLFMAGFQPDRPGA
jgi:predicted Zn finger-like uncharacterized protein